MRTLFKLCVVLFTFFCSNIGFAQIVASDDVFLCVSEEVTLEANANGIDGTDTGISSDDTFGGIVNIGFNFEFYGNTYNQCVIASNNYISFNLGNANGYSPWPINEAVPSPNNPLNAILCPWQDINPGVGGNIQYSTSGEAPNRVFTVTFCAIPMFSCTDICYTSQIKLFETTNVIETHISEKPICDTWNGGQAIHALHNINGTIAHVVTGPDGIVRNYIDANNDGIGDTQWAALEDGFRFTPNGSNDYIIEEIPYQPVISGNTVTWLDIDGNVVGTGNSLTITPTETTSYYAQAELCEGGGCDGFGGGTAQDEVNIFFEEIDINYDVISASCSWEESPDGQITSSPSGTGPFDFVWVNENGEVIQETIGENTDVLNNIPPGNYILSVSTPLGCLDEEEIFVDMDGVMATDALAGDDQEICSSTTNFSANNINSDVDDYGQWELISGSGIIGNVNNPMSPVSGLSIGDNVFEWSITNDCGTTVDQVVISVLDGNPVISIPTSPITCLLNTSLSATVEGDVMVWSGDGPGNINFSTPNSLSTNVTVDQYGLYDFSFMGCSGIQTVSVEFITEAPNIIDAGTIYCDFETDLEVNNIDNIIGWSLYSSPAGSDVFIEDPTELTTSISVSEYGTYQFMFQACGSFDITSITFAEDQPMAMGPSHQDCVLTADLIAFTQAQNGEWTVITEPNCIEEGLGEVVEIFDPMSNSTMVEVPCYGLYEFQYTACNVSSSVEVGFSCELDVPNVITANNDGLNDEFQIEGLDTELYSNTLLTIFDRWGALVYVQPNYGLNGIWWNGQIILDSDIDDYGQRSGSQVVNDGVYYYVLDVFNKAQGQKETYSGNVMIVKDSFVD